MKNAIKLTKVFLLVILTSTIFADPQTDLVNKRFGSYLDYMKAGQYDLASARWLPEYVYEVYKFGIYYSNVPFKYDCNSYLARHIQDYMKGEIEVTYSALPSMYEVYKILARYKNKSDKNSQEIRDDYYLMRGDNADYFIAPQYWPLLKNIKVKEGEYFKLYYFKESQINDSALTHTDKIIREIAAKLELSDDLLERLSLDKLNYFLCENANQIAIYAGEYKPGWHDPAGNFIITNYLPHGTPIADFMIKYKLRELPFYALPFMEKGLSVYLGGRAGASLDVFGQMAKFSLESDFMKLEDILSSNDFAEKTGGPDFSYTLSAYFMDYLVGQFGIEKILSLYLKLSGDMAFVDSCSMDTIKDILKDETGKSWSSLEKGFKEYFASMDFGLELTDLAEGDIVYQTGTPKYSVTLFENGDDLILDAQSIDKTSPVNAAFLLKEVVPGATGEYQSSLFEKHFPEREYDGQCFGMILGPEEIGVYNYLTNNIEAKYISSLANPGNPIDPAHITFKIPIKLLPGAFDRLTLEFIEIP